MRAREDGVSYGSCVQLKWERFTQATATACHSFQRRAPRLASRGPSARHATAKARIPAHAKHSGPAPNATHPGHYITAPLRTSKQPPPSQRLTRLPPQPATTGTSIPWTTMPPRTPGSGCQVQEADTDTGVCSMSRTPSAAACPRRPARAASASCKTCMRTAAISRRRSLRRCARQWQSTATAGPRCAPALRGVPRQCSCTCCRCLTLMHVQVAEHVPGRTARQCSEHHLLLSSRNVRDMTSIWRRDVEMILLEARAKHCVGTRSPNWVAVAAQVSEAAGVQLTVEDCKRKSKLLVRRLHSAGLPQRASVEGQLQFALQNPGALMTSDDRKRLKLQQWAAERGLAMRAEASDMPRTKAGGHPASTPGRDTPELLRQSRYLRVLAGLTATPGGLEVRGDSPPPEALEPEDDAGPAGAEPGVGDGSADGTDAAPPSTALPDVDPCAHPVAAAVVNLLRVRLGCAVERGGVAGNAARADAGDDAAAAEGVGGAAHVQLGAAPGSSDGVEDAWAMQVSGAMLEGRHLHDVRTCAERRRARIHTLHKRGLLQVRLRMPQLRQQLVEDAVRRCRPRKRRRQGDDTPGRPLEQNEGAAGDAPSEGAAGATASLGVPSCPAAGVLVEQVPLKWACQRGSAPRTKRRRGPTSKSTAGKAAVASETGAGVSALRDNGTVPAGRQEAGSQAALPGPAAVQEPSEHSRLQATNALVVAAPSAEEREAHAACALSRAGEGGRRSGRKRKFTRKVDPDGMMAV